MTNGAVPIAKVEVICPVADTVVNAPLEGVVAPTVPLNALPVSVSADAVPPVIATAAADCVAMVPRPRLVRADDADDKFDRLSALFAYCTVKSAKVPAVRRNWQYVPEGHASADVPSRARTMTENVSDTRVVTLMTSRCVGETRLSVSTM